MKGISIVAIASAVGLLAGCATGYHTQDVLRGGFRETQLDTNVFRVSSQGNEFTRQEAAEDYVLLRSADVTLANGFTHFAIADAKSHANTSYIAMPIQSYTSSSATVIGHTAFGSATTTTYGGQVIAVKEPSTTNTIVTFNGKPNIPSMVYDARFICESLGGKYDVTCGSVNR